MLVALIIGITGGLAGVYYFTQLETEKSKLIELRAEVRTLRALLDGVSISAPAMILLAPVDNTSVTSPLMVTGRAIAFESTVNARVLDGTGLVLAEASGRTDAVDVGVFGDFAIELEFDPPTTTSGTVAVFEYSARDGSMINEDSATIVFQVAQ